MLHREVRHRAGAQVFPFRGGARSARGGQAAHQERGPPYGGELRQAAGAGAPKWLKVPMNCRDVTAQHVGHRPNARLVRRTIGKLRRPPLAGWRLL